EDEDGQEGDASNDRKREKVAFQSGVRFGPQQLVHAEEGRGVPEIDGQRPLVHPVNDGGDPRPHRKGPEGTPESQRAEEPGEPECRLTSAYARTASGRKSKRGPRRCRQASKSTGLASSSQLRQRRYQSGAHQVMPHCEPPGSQTGKIHHTTCRKEIAASAELL